jgi:hypothetical protein
VDNLTNMGVSASYQSSGRLGNRIISLVAVTTGINLGYRWSRRVDTPQTERRPGLLPAFFSFLKPKA